jgi:hypothetical protein
MHYDVHKIKINELTIKHTLKSLPQKLSYLNDQETFFLRNMNDHHFGHKSPQTDWNPIYFGMSYIKIDYKTSNITK